MTGEPSGDLLLRNARLVGEAGEPVDLAVADGVIAGIAAGIEPGDAELVDLDGRWVLPGLADRHVHLTHWATASRRFDLSGAGSAAEAAALAAAALAGGAAEVVGYGFRDGLWTDAPTVAALDAATGERPVVLVSGDLHCVWLNSAALARHKIDPAGVDGLIREQPAFAGLRTLDEVDDATQDSWALDALAAAAARGVTRITDLEMRWNLDDWTRRAAAAALAARIDFGIYPADLDRAIELGLRTGQVIPGTRGRVAVGPLKIVTDGSLNTRTAWCVDPYPGLENSDHPRGRSTVPPEELTALLRLARSHGLAVAVHAIGDRANQAALDAFAATGATGSIEHAQLLRREDVARFASLGVVAGVQPEHAMDDRDVADRYWAGRTDRAFLLRALHEAGAVLAFGSDAPVAPLDPWVTIAAAVTRSRGGREPWHPEQAVDVRTALAASVDSPRLRPGVAADLVAMDADPLTASGEELRTWAVHATLLAGEWTHRAG